MRSPRRRTNAFRTARFESFEPRVVLSASPASPLAADSIVQSSYSSVFSASNSAAFELTGLAEALSKYDFTGEGQTWTKYQALRLKGRDLVRTESNPVASFSYAKCD